MCLHHSYCNCWDVLLTLYTEIMLRYGRSFDRQLAKAYTGIWIYSKTTMPGPPVTDQKFLSALLLLTTFLQLPQHAYSDICTSSVCEFELVIAMQQSLVYQPPGGRNFDVDLDPDGVLRVVNSTARPTANFSEFIGLPVPDPRKVITVDGVKRNLFTINGQFPGPTLEVMEGAKVS